MVGGMPVVGRPGIGGPRGPSAALPPGSRPLALPAASSTPRYPSPPALPPAPPALPSGPVAGSGYGQMTSIYGTPGQSPSAGHGYGADRPGQSSDPPSVPAATSGYGAQQQTGYGAPNQNTEYGGNEYGSGIVPGYPSQNQQSQSSEYGSGFTPGYGSSSSTGTGQPYGSASPTTSYSSGNQPSGYASTAPPALPSPPAPPAPPPPATSEPTSYVPLYAGGVGTSTGGGMTDGRGLLPAQRTDSPAIEPEVDRSTPDECATLRSECEQLRERATQAATAAAVAAQQAETAQAEHAVAARAAQDARRAHEALVREAAEIASEIAALERMGPTPGNEKLQQETSHAAFSAFRRGDISSEQLREVFRRAEGWTPEHDRLAKRSADLRGEEADAARARIDAERVEQNAAESARLAVVTARAMDDAARDAATDARGRCAAAEACEQRVRRR